jgi:hypothetical protein
MASLHSHLPQASFLGGIILNMKHYIELRTRNGSVTVIPVDGSPTEAQSIGMVASLAGLGDEPAPQKITQWAIAGGTIIRVKTPKLPDETVAQQCARHDAFVAELQEEFPPVSGN